MESIAFPIADAPFILGCPEDLPTTERELAPSAAMARQIQEYLEAGQQPQNLEQYLGTLREVMAHLPSASTGLMTDDPRENQENRDNDFAFGIERHQGDTIALMVKATLNAAIQTGELVQRSGTSLDHSEWSDMMSVVQTILQTIASPRLMPESRVMFQAPKNKVEEDEQDPLRRWVRGHLLFMALCQAMNLCTNLLITAAQDKDLELACAQANRLIQLMNISRITLEFSTDLNSQQYVSQIRPTLMPPIAPPKMSGINWRDHVVMIRSMRRSTEAWNFIEQTYPHLAERMRATLAQVYSAHRGVCEKFVGEENTSLLATEKATNTAGQVLENLKKSRLKYLKTKGCTGTG
ncbi:hypothetical protein SB759_22670 [Pseudomonas sp. SIMBA_059]